MIDRVTGRLRRLRRVPAPEPDVATMRAELKRLRGRVKALNGQVRRLQADLVAPAPGDDELDRYSYVFVVTYGRSGSTLLAGILNSIPGYTIRGENDLVLARLHDFHRALSARQEQFLPSAPLEPEHPWYGVELYNPELALREMRRLAVDTLFVPGPDSRVLGHKEIRWHDVPDLPRFLTFLRRMLPGTKFVFNSRDHDEVLASKFWVGKDAAALAAVQQQLDRAEAAHAGVSYHVHYNDYRDDPRALRGLFEFLGEPFDAERVAAVMARPHSY